jgi:hypothetical protein
MIPAIMAADLLSDRILLVYMAEGLPILRILVDRDTGDYAGIQNATLRALPGTQ